MLNASSQYLADDRELFAFLSGEKDLLQAIGEKPMIKVGTKRDLGGVSQGADIFLSSLQDDLTPLIALILKKLDLDKKEESAFLGKREEDYIASIVTKLDEAFSTIKETHQIDIASDTIRQALDLINALMGEGATQSMEDIYQTLFSRFCLGK